MNKRTGILAAAVLATFLLGLSAVGGQAQQQQPMGFFVTSVGPGDGATLGGLEEQTGTARRWPRPWAPASDVARLTSARLSVGAAPRERSRSYRKRPLYNANGVRIAWNVSDLHGDIERDRQQQQEATALNERGEVVNGVGDRPNQHDILTGSNSHGRGTPGRCQTPRPAATGRATVRAEPWSAITTG